MNNPSKLHHLCIVVPEFRTEAGRAGGLDSVAQFVIDAFTGEPQWEIEVASVRMHHAAPEHRRIIAPATLLRGPRTTRRTTDGISVTDFGAQLGELEVVRYLPRDQLDRYLARFDAAIIVAGSPAIVNVARRAGIPVVAQIATFIREERAALLASSTGLRGVARRVQTEVVSRMDERGLRVADTILVENRHMLEACQARGLKDVRLIPPGVDTDRFHPRNADSPSQGYILAVGRLNDHRKDLPSLIRAYHHARSLGTTQRLVLAGIHGPTESDMQLMTELGIREHVDILIDVPATELPNLYRHADLFALTSAEEGLGIVFLEAMASGTPVLTTDTEGAKFAIGDCPAGELVPLGRGLGTRFGQRLAAWCADPAKRTSSGLAARERALETFSAKTTGRQFREAVDALISR